MSDNTVGANFVRPFPIQTERKAKKWTFRFTLKPKRRRKKMDKGKLAVSASGEGHPSISTALLLAAVMAIGIQTGWAQEQRRDSQPKPKAAVYIMGNPEGRDALRMAVNTFLVKSGKYQMVAVDAIDVVAKEQKRQMSGSVSDGDIAKLGRDAGAEYVCVVERSDFDGYAYVATRMISVQSKVAEFADMVELPQGGKIIDIIQWQIGSMLGMAVGPRPTGSAQAQTSQRSKEEIQAEIQRLEQRKREGEANRTGNVAPSTVNATVVTTPGIQGTIVPGGSLAQKLTWLQKSADSHTTYIVEVTADEKIAPFTFEFKGGINITVVLRGVGGNRTVMLQSHGTMFTVQKEVTFILDNNITLRGHSGNSGTMVRIEGGLLKMNAGSTIIGNNNGDSHHGGGGVFLSDGSFEMTGGTISGNTASTGGGVMIWTGLFTMMGGTISNNVSREGGGVYVGNFNKFIMRGGTISNNSAKVCGGGVWLSNYDVFTKTGGTITGYKNDPTNGNVVKDADDGSILARKGHAIYRDENKRKETTSGPSSIFKGDSGDWDQ
jgi:hypothetical protein